MRYDDAELLARINRPRTPKGWAEDWGFDYLTAVLGLVVLAIIMALCLLPAPKAAGSSTSIASEVRAAKAHCAVVVVEHKVKPQLPTEVVASGCNP